MKKGKYVKSIVRDDTIYYINGVNDAWFSVPKNQQYIFDTLLEYPESQDACFNDTIENLYKNGFLIDSDNDEKAKIKQLYNFKRDQDSYSLMILPTYQCNLRCWYCIQQHKNMWMNANTVKAIKKRIELMLAIPEIKKFRLAWFGGEPLLCYNLVKDLTSYAKSIAEKYHKEFICDITTNSTLLDDFKINELRQTGVTSYQITIDGEQSIHDKIKQLEGKSSFRVALHHINQIAKHSHCILRYNYTAETLKEADKMLEQIDNLIDKDVRHNIRFLVCKVWQEDFNDIDVNAVDRILSKGRKLGFISTPTGSDICYADHKRFECIIPDGKVGLCDNDEIDSLPGQIQSDGSIIWDSTIKNYKPLLFEDSIDYKCSDCDYLPFCWGLCPKNRAALISKGLDIPCQNPTQRERDELVWMKIQILNSFLQPISDN